MNKHFLPALALLLASMATARAVTISGTLLGHDGRPMRAAHVHLATNMQSLRPEQSVATSADGHFTMTTAASGRIMLRFSGVDHAAADVPLVLFGGNDLAIDVRLGTHAFGADYDHVTVIGSFNDFVFTAGQRMKKLPNGTYTATFKTDESEFSYQLVFPGSSPQSSFSANGTDATRYEYDGGGDYRSVVTPRKHAVTVTFDPRKLPPPGLGESVIIRDSTTSAIVAIMHRIDERRDRMMSVLRERIASGKELGVGGIDWSDEAKSLAARIDHEPNASIRAALLMSYCELNTQMAEELDSTIARRALRELPPTSPMWGYDPGVVNSAIALTGQDEQYREYFWRTVREHPDTNVRTGELETYLIRNQGTKDTAIFRAVYHELVDKYPDSYEARRAMAEYNPDRAIQVGRPVPAFDLVSLDDGVTHITNETMKGKVYLIDFWATWCGPCVGEMPHLHAAYDKFHGRGLEIVSISFDRSPGDVAPFRAKKWKMPWKHGFADGAFDSDLATRFEVVGIPKPMLVDATGTIIATENVLRGAALEGTLEKIFDRGTH